MIEIITGERGKGKTKQMLDKANNGVKVANGSVVYVDKSQQHMYELDRNIRLINMCDFSIESTDEFLGFLSGMISQNNDIEEIYLDSFLTIAGIDTNEGLCKAIEKLDKISNQFNLKFILSVSKNEADLPDCAKSKIVLSL